MAILLTNALRTAGKSKPKIQKHAATALLQAALLLLNVVLLRPQCL
ncbi:MAG: hypothetical protein RL660_2940 [Bacteroidota bacterium]